ncbi:MAG: phosphoribosyl-ATP diphosphatase [Chloroflexi bacterium]|nr:MAG: phosphoribosyl-ATP diphosphatase [Chloroflexota bacterium]
MRVLDELYTTLIDRKKNPKEGSYTNQLLSSGEDEILKKVGEEAIEVILAAKGQGEARLVEEIADLTYHILVLLAAKNITLLQVEEELAQRRGRTQG